MKKIAIAGFGTVGGGIAHLLHDNQKILTDNAGENISLGAILVRRKKTDSEFADLMTTDFETIEKLCNLFDCSISDLLELENVEEFKEEQAVNI